MGEKYSRRDLIRMLGASGVAAGLGGLAAPGHAPADELVQNGGFAGSIVQPEAVQSTMTCPTLVDGKVIQPRRELTVFHQTDVLVVGGGTAGVTAAVAARRSGAAVTLVERYGHLGGLWTGGLVLVVIGHIVKGGKQVCQGIGEEMLRRLDKVEGGIVHRQPGVNPTVDAEALKYVMVDMVEEAGVRTLLHCWGVDAIMDGNTIRGAVVESKSGRQAILAKVVVDTTGDGDLFAAAGAPYQRCKYSIGLVSRIGNLDKVDDAKANRTKIPKGLGAITPIPGVNWVNMTGPMADGLDVAELSRLEMNHRRFIWKNVQRIRSTPGYEHVFLMETAPQLGVRITRMLRGVKTLTMQGFKAGSRFPDVVAVGGAAGCNHDEWQIPYGALVPKNNVENVLAAGRCISAELKMADMVRVIPICWITGHAAGVAAAVAVEDRCHARDVDVSKVQRVLKQQEAYLG
jgi:NADPH-dependent 2,4-dienoyl-CoA reductase/sulfur reductase-like enzyme